MFCRSDFYDCVVAAVEANSISFHSEMACERGRPALAAAALQHSHHSRQAQHRLGPSFLPRRCKAALEAAQIPRQAAAAGLLRQVELLLQVLGRRVVRPGAHTKIVSHAARTFTAELSLAHHRACSAVR